MSLKPLSRETIRRISTGPVIVDLTSVVKELIENAIDAGATEIDVSLEGGGMTMIKVKDNGTGIKREDYDKVTAQFYTSKIDDFSGLEKLTTYGFRGEALYALCTVADVSITTRTAADEHASTIHYTEHGTISGEIERGFIGVGTEVTVRKLFHRVPVREEWQRQRLRSGVEVRQLEKLFHSYCLTHYALGFHLRNPPRRAIDKPPCTSVSAAIRTLFGQTVIRNLQVVNFEAAPTALHGVDSGDGRPPLVLQGYLPSADLDPADPKQENAVKAVMRADGARFFFVNRRPVDMPRADKLINATLRKHFAVDRRRYPFYVLSVDMPPAAIDVNLEPNKRRLLLRDERGFLECLKLVLMSLYPKAASDNAAQDVDEDDTAAAAAGGDKDDTDRRTATGVARVSATAVVSSDDDVPATAETQYYPPVPSLDTPLPNTATAVSTGDVPDEPMDIPTPPQLRSGTAPPTSPWQPKQRTRLGVLAPPPPELHEAPLEIESSVDVDIVTDRAAQVAADYQHVDVPRTPAPRFLVTMQPVSPPKSPAAANRGPIDVDVDTDMPAARPAAAGDESELAESSVEPPSESSVLTSPTAPQVGQKRKRSDDYADDDDSELAPPPSKLPRTGLAAAASSPAAPVLTVTMDMVRDRMARIHSSANRSTSPAAANGSVANTTLTCADLVDTVVVGRIVQRSPDTCPLFLIAYTPPFSESAPANGTTALFSFNPQRAEEALLYHSLKREYELPRQRLVAAIAVSKEAMVGGGSSADWLWELFRTQCAVRGGRYEKALRYNGFEIEPIGANEARIVAMTTMIPEYGIADLAELIRLIGAAEKKRLGSDNVAADVDLADMRPARVAVHFRAEAAKLARGAVIGQGKPTEEQVRQILLRLHRVGIGRLRCPHHKPLLSYLYSLPPTDAVGATFATAVHHEQLQQQQQSAQRENR